MSIKPDRTVFIIGSDPKGRRLELEIEADELTLVRKPSRVDLSETRLTMSPLEAVQLREVLKS